ncbi:flagellar protein [Brevibacillus composti]|uniref:Flagellar protein n=1 Tax=Brevibacillus composti TaxID=2796470 RepID=A0A7T5EP25_9BACL|nr:TIGR02530 family flagellar biosynthesis protein [Brevibacillus composti]QQE76134.1 flagellar protein [Brevibacillus composti]QUO43163.1 flagellar protein [Brevibacillus composti]
MKTFHIGQTYFPVKPSQTAPLRPGSTAPSGKAFRDYLADSIEQTRGNRTLTFSQHALNRLQESGITLDESKLDRLASGLKKAADKGARESLIMMDNVAYVVSIQNQKVITAVDDKRMRDNVFTNIDSAVFV